MKPLFPPFLLLMLAACVSVAVPPSAPSDARISASAENADIAAMIARGAAFAATNCAACHATGATGNSPHDTAPAFRDIGKRYPVSQLSEAFAEGIVTAHPGMPEFMLTPDENRALIAWLESVQTSGNPASTDGNSGGLPNS